MKRKEKGKTAILKIIYINLYEFKFKFNLLYEKLRVSMYIDSI